MIKSFSITKKNQFTIQLIFLSYHKKYLHKCIDLIQQNLLVNKPFIKIPQKTNKICLIKSPFIHKKSQEIFEIKTYKVIHILKVSFQQKLIITAFLHFLLLNLPPGIDLKIKLGI